MHHPVFFKSADKQLQKIQMPYFLWVQCCTIKTGSWDTPENSHQTIPNIPVSVILKYILLRLIWKLKIKGVKRKGSRIRKGNIMAGKRQRVDKTSVGESAYWIKSIGRQREGDGEREFRKVERRGTWDYDNPMIRMFLGNRWGCWILPSSLYTAGQPCPDKIYGH